MDDLIQLWLPVLTTAVFVFIASSLIHMVFKWHNSDYRKLSNEDEVMAALRAGSATCGSYVFPHCVDMKAMQDKAMAQKYREGPIGFLTVAKPGAPNMVPALAQWFVLNVATAAIAACVAWQAFGLNGHSHDAGHLVGMISFLAYAVGSVQNGIWMGKPWGSVAKDVLDALIYATISALTFWWLWP